jgi:VWFA-related protein
MRRPYACSFQLLTSLFLAATLLLSVAAPVRAQSSDIIVTIDEVDLATFPTVHMRVGVRSRNGVPIAELEPQHFEIIEDGATALPATTVAVESNPASQVSLAIVIDTYRTLSGAPIEAAQKASNDLLNDLLDESGDRDRAAFVAVHTGVSTDPQVLDEQYEVAFTNDRNRLLNVINFLHERMETSASGTPLYDAVIKAVRLAAATEPVGHRALIVMTDGEDRESISTDNDVIQTATNERTPVFTVGLSNSRLNEQFLRRLADQTGGMYQAAQTPDDFSPLFANVLTMLRTQYVLTYETGLPDDGQPHSLLLHVRTPTDLEGFHEQRVQMPGAAAQEVEQPAEPLQETPSPPAATPAPTATPEEDFLASVQDLVQENMLLAILGVGAVGLALLILVAIIILVVRRRRAGAGEEELDMPPLPEAPGYEPSYVPPFGGGQSEYEVPTGRAQASPQPPPSGPSGPSPTIPSVGGPSPSTRPSYPPAGPPTPPPPLAEPPPQAPAQQPPGGTRIMDRKPKLSKVGLLVDAERPERRFDVDRPSMTIGRGQDSDVMIEHPTVSRQHAAIKLEGDQFRLYDLGSSNGTFVGEQRVREPVILDDGDRVRFGAVEFVFKVVSLGQ